MSDLRTRLDLSRGPRRTRLAAWGYAACLSLAATAAVAPAARAQTDEPGVRLTGIGMMLGIVSPENAETGFAIGGRVSVGSLARTVRLGAGVTYWSADIDRGDLGTGASGSISDLAFDVDLRLMPARVKMVRPYVLGALALHRVEAEIGDDRSLADALTGTNIGLDIGIGAESSRAGLGWRAEIRRRLVSDVEAWQLTAGARYTFGSTPG